MKREELIMTDSDILDHSS